MLADIKEAAQKAILQIQPVRTPEDIYTEVRQGPSESSSSFIDRLTQALDRQVSDETAKPQLLQNLTFANAYTECKWIISLLTSQQ